MKSRQQTSPAKKQASQAAETALRAVQSAHQPPSRSQTASAVTGPAAAQRMRYAFFRGGRFA